MTPANDHMTMKDEEHPTDLGGYLSWYFYHITHCRIDLSIFLLQCETPLLSAAGLEERTLDLESGDQLLNPCCVTYEREDPREVPPLVRASDISAEMWCSTIKPVHVGFP